MEREVVAVALDVGRSRGNAGDCLQEERGRNH